jgi:hypothetical protein
MCQHQHCNLWLVGIPTRPYNGCGKIKSVNQLKHFALTLCLIAGLNGAAARAEEVERGGKHSLAVFGGPVTDTNFTESVFAPWSNDIRNIGVVGAAYNYRYGTLNEVFSADLPAAFGDHVLLESEVGGSYRFGNEKLGEGWIGLYLRYDGFFWNDTVYTTLALNTGLSVLTEESEFERGRDSNSKNNILLHYMGPELTFASPDNKNLEVLFRYHHRSGVFGLFDGVVSGSTFLSTGLRYRF